MRNHLILAFVFSLSAQFAFAGNMFESLSLENGVEDKLRTCCAFGNNKILKKVRISRVTSPRDLGDHRFIFGEDHSWKKEKNGLIYTCKAGFIDITHLRDHADITLHIYNKLLNNDKVIHVKKFPTKRKFIVGDVSNLSREDLASLAASMAYEIAVWHEIATLPKFNGFNIQANSAFSVEDNISNYLGTELGYLAIVANTDFNSEMTRSISDFLVQAEAADSKEATENILDDLKKSWWKNGFGFKSVLKRDTKPYGMLKPLIPTQDISKHISCSEPERTYSFSTTRVLNNGKKPQDYFDFEVDTTKKMRKYLSKHNITISDKKIHQSDFSEIIESSIPHFVDKLGAEYNK